MTRAEFLTTVAATVIGTMIANLLWQTFRDARGLQLFYTAAACQLEVDTKSVPLLGVTFDRETVRAYDIAIVNGGSLPQQRVRVEVENLGEIVSVACQPAFAIEDAVGRRLESMDSFQGRTALLLEIPSLPASEICMIRVLAYPKPRLPMPTVRVSSDALHATCRSPNPVWVAGIRAELVYQLRLGSPDELHELKWQ